MQVSSLGSGRFPGVGNGNPLQCSQQENPMDRGVWWAAVHRVAKSRTQLSKRAHAHTHTHTPTHPHTPPPVETDRSKVPGSNNSKKKLTDYLMNVYLL